MRLLFLLLLGCSQLLHAQNCTFDFGNEGWYADPDAVGNLAVWESTGGNPGGYIKTVDSDQGGTWYFVASNKFLGVKCDAYGRFLRYDQFASMNSPASNTPDIEITGGGITLVFDNPVLPGSTWTHYDVLLREDAGWRVGNLNGFTPTAAQFKQVLADVTKLRIRGEYRSFGSDFGGLDNVILESDFSFEFDLDADNSSGATGGNFQAAPTCIPRGFIVDEDVILSTEARIDSIFISIQAGTALEILQLSATSPNILVQQNGPGKITLVNTGAATEAEFIALLKLIEYIDNRALPLTGVRVISIRVFTDCGVVGATYRAFLPIYLQPYAGMDGDTVLCQNGGLIDLRIVLRDNPDNNGSWEPALNSGTNYFDPKLDSAGTYTYIIPNAEPCAGDTAQVTVEIHYPFLLRSDTTICYDKSIVLEVPRGLSDWTWSTGSTQPQISIDAPGTYTLLGSTDYCTYSDSVAISFYSCVPCPPYAPNVFSPNDDGLNDAWHIFLHCRWSEYRVEVYDRWGSLVFQADDPESVWDGRVGGKLASSGVYVWRMFWRGELFGEPMTWKYQGDVTVVR